MGADPKQLSEKLGALDDDTLTSVISQILQRRPEIAPGFIDKVCPDLTYAPTKAITTRRCNGVIKATNMQMGTATIDCPEMRAIFEADVQVHMNRLGDLKTGDAVSFALTLNQESEPWGFDLQLDSNGGSSDSSANMNDINNQMMAMMNSMNQESSTPSPTPPNPMVPGGMDMSAMMAGMNKDGAGGMDMSNMMNMMQTMQKSSAGGMDMSGMNGMNPMGMMMQMMSMMSSMMSGMNTAGGMGGMNPAGGMGGMNPMATMMGPMGGGMGGGMAPGMPNPMMPGMGMPADGVANPMMAAMGGTAGALGNNMQNTEVCNFYTRSGWCKYGDECMLQHIGPAKPPPDMQTLGEYMGVIKSYNTEKGFGFIACDQLKREGHKGDVFLSSKHAGEFQLKAEVKFTACLVDGKLQARNLTDATGQVGEQTSFGKAGAGGGEEDIGEFVGTIKSYNLEKGFGFIVCPLLRSQGWDMDVFLPPDTIGSLSVGSTVSFTAYKREGKLRAKDLVPAPEDFTVPPPPPAGMPGGP